MVWKEKGALTEFADKGRGRHEHHGAQDKRRIFMLRCSDHDLTVTLFKGAAQGKLTPFPAD